jgi:tetratricopeptide (TPR) repeat protein
MLATALMFGCGKETSDDRLPGMSGGPAPRVSPLDFEGRAKGLVAGALRATAFDAYQNGDYGVALEALLSSRELSGSSSDDDFLARLYQRNNDLSHAIEVYEHILSRDDERNRRYRQEPAIWTNFGEALLTVGRTDEALEAFKNATQGMSPPEGAKSEEGHRAFAHLMAGHYCNEFGSIYERLEHYKLAVELAPNWEKARLRLNDQCRLSGLLRRLPRQGKNL